MARANADADEAMGMWPTRALLARVEKAKHGQLLNIDATTRHRP